jgi:MoaA/NifB/PqqE/SkfB family radical SAM enzyme
MDGVGRTYEELRGRSFEELLRRIELLRSVARVGINFVVNARTVPDLTSAAELAATLGAAEFLLLPEQPVRGRDGIDNETASKLRDWIGNYCGPVPLAISELGADDLPTCNAFEREIGVRSYAFVSAEGTLKASSFAASGVTIGHGTLMEAVEELQKRKEE